jgi:hypothetical protein
MLFESAKPQPRPLHLSWHYQKIPPGGELKGWIAGEMVGVHCHWGGDNSKPCWKKITGNLLRCPRCDAELTREIMAQPAKLRWIGYVPLIVYQSLKREVVVVSESVGPRVEALPVGCAVKFVRTQGKRDPLQVHQLESRDTGGSIDALGARPKWIGQKLRGEDITEWLLNLWEEPGLKEFFLKKPSASEQESSVRSSNEHKNDSPTLPATAPVKLTDSFRAFLDEKGKQTEARIRAEDGGEVIGEDDAGVLRRARRGKK